MEQEGAVLSKEMMPVYKAPRWGNMLTVCPDAIPRDVFRNSEKRLKLNFPGEVQPEMTLDESLEVLAVAGGMDPIEILCVLEDNDYPEQAVKEDAKKIMLGAVHELMRRIGPWLSDRGVFPEATFQPAWQWVCQVCQTVCTIDRIIPKVQCRFCRTVHKVPAPARSEDGETPSGASGSYGSDFHA